MPDCKNIDELIVDRLYGELDEAKAAWFDEHVSDCGNCHAEWESLSRTRALLSELPDAEPPQSVSAILLHEAAKRAPAPSKSKARMADEERPGLLDRIGAWLFPVLRHPAAAAVAVLVLVAGVAGSLYVRGDSNVAEPSVASRAETPASAASANQPGAGEMQGKLSAGLDSTTERENLEQDSYAADILDKEATKSLRLKLQESREEPKKSIEIGTIQPAVKTPTAGKKRSWGAAGSRSAKGKRGASVTANAVSGADEIVQDDSDEDGAAQQKIGKSNAKRERRRGVSSGSTQRYRNGITTGGSSKGDSAERDRRSKDTRSVAKPKPAPRRPATIRSKSTRSNKSSKKKKVAPNKPAPPSVTGRGSVNYTIKKDPQSETRWAKQQQVTLWKAIKGKKCLSAARIANNIRDRNPGYYKRNIGSSRNLKPCVVYVRRESTRRMKSRAQAARAKAAKRSGASAPKSKKAAPRRSPAADFEKNAE